MLLGSDKFNLTSSLLLLCATVTSGWKAFWIGFNSVEWNGMKWWHPDLHQACLSWLMLILSLVPTDPVLALAKTTIPPLSQRQQIWAPPHKPHTHSARRHFQNILVGMQWDSLVLNCAWNSVKPLAWNAKLCGNYSLVLNHGCNWVVCEITFCSLQIHTA